MLVRSDISPSQKEAYARRMCAFMSFEIEWRPEHRVKPLWVVASRSENGESWTGWTFRGWDHALFGCYNTGTLEVASLDAELTDYIERGHLWEPVDFDYMRYAKIKSETVEELELKLTALGY